MKNKFLFKLNESYPLIYKYISNFVQWNAGFKKEEESEKDYAFGAENINKTIVSDNGQWTDVLPDEEIQRGRYVDVMACVSFGLLNVLEMLAKKKYNKDWNKSDRFTAKMTNTTKQGNGLRNVLDLTRNLIGVVNETSWAWDRDFLNWNEYYTDIPNEIKTLGRDWLKEYSISYERVSPNTQLMMQALKYSPLYVSGYAWYKEGELYRSYGNANHCFTVVGYVEGSHWLVFDSYSPYVKKLAWDYQFGSVYIIVLDKLNIKYNQNEIDKLIDRGFTYIQRPMANGEVYKLFKNGLKKVDPQEIKDISIRNLANNKKLVGITEELYISLLD